MEMVRRNTNVTGYPLIAKLTLKYHEKKSRNNSEKIAGSDSCDYDQCKDIDQCDIGRVTLRDMKKRKCQYGCNGQYDYGRYDIVP